MVKDTDFKFDLHVPMDSPDMTAYKISEKGAWPESRDPLKFNWQIYIQFIFIHRNGRNIQLAK